MFPVKPKLLPKPFSLRKNNPLNAEQLQVFKGHNHSVYALCEALRPGYFYATGGDRLVVEWNLAHPADAGVIARSISTVYSIAVIPEQHILVIGQAQGGLHIIDLDQKKEIRYLTVHHSGIFCIKYDPVNNRLFAAAADGCISVWNTTTWELIRKIKVAEEKIRSLDISPELNLVAIACSDANVYLLDYTTLSPVHHFNAHAWSTNAIAWHPTHPWLITGSKDAHIRIWNAEKNYEMIGNIPAHNYAIYAIGFSPGGLYMATASRDKTVKIWDAENFNILKRLDIAAGGHTHSVNTLLWLSSGELLTAGDDRKIISWKIE